MDRPFVFLQSGRFLSAGELVGRLSEKAAGELGLRAGVAVGSGVIDAYAGWIGTVGAEAAEPGRDNEDALDPAAPPPGDIRHAFTRLAAVAGTSTCHLVMSADAVFVDGVWGPYRDVLVPGYWMAEGGQSATGELLRHVVHTHAAFRETADAAAAAGQNVYDFLNDHLHRLAAEAGVPAVSYLGRHLFFYGDLWGNRSPVADANMRGAVVGLGSDAGRDALALLYYAAMESIALQTRQIVEAMNRAGHAIRSIFMSGSQCQNSLLMALLADACHLPVLIPQYANAAVVHGAAMLGVKAASAGPDGATEALWSIMRRMSKPARVVTPGTDPVERRLLEAKYHVFLEQCRTQREYRKLVDDAIRG